VSAQIRAARSALEHDMSQIDTLKKRQTASAARLEAAVNAVLAKD
jgi:hypothetical protein